MALTGFTARNLLNNVGGSLLMPSGFNRFLGLFTTAPGDNDAGAVEVTGGSYARVQMAGSAVTNAVTAAANNTLHFASTPAWIVAGMQIQDTTTAGAIPAGTTVTSTTSTTVVMSANATGGGVLNGDTISFSAFGAATSQGPATALSIAAVTFAQATLSWGTVVAVGIFDALTAGNLLDWDWLGNDPWVPCSITLASPGVVTAIGITANSSPALANGDSVAFTARFGGTLPVAISSETLATVAGLSADTFNVGINTASTGSGLVRKVTQQPVAANVTVSFSSGALSIVAA